MRPDELDALFTRLAEPGLSAGDGDRILAELEGRELEALPELFRRLRDSEDDAELRAVALVLRRWVALPLASALPASLRALIDEPEVGDLNKIMAAALLESFGEPMRESELAARLRDPLAVKKTALERMLRTAADPFDAVALQSAIAGQPEPAILALIGDLAASGRPEAETLLGPLAHRGDSETAFAAIAALDAVGAGVAVDALALIAAHHARPTVRREAERSLLHLQAREERRSPPADEVTAWMPDAGEAGPARLIVLARHARPASGNAGAALSLALDAEGAIGRYALARDLDAAGWRELLARSADAGIPLVPASASEAYAALEAATARSLAAGAGPDVGWAGWRRLLPRPEAGREPEAGAG